MGRNNEWQRDERHLDQNRHTSTTGCKVKSVVRFEDDEFGVKRRQDSVAKKSLSPGSFIPLRRGRTGIGGCRNTRDYEGEGAYQASISMRAIP